ncbi:MAG: histidine kinase [Pirellulaceae bacterium]
MGRLKGVIFWLALLTAIGLLMASVMSSNEQLLQLTESSVRQVVVESLVFAYFWGLVYLVVYRFLEFGQQHKMLWWKRLLGHIIIAFVSSTVYLLVGAAYVSPSSLKLLGSPETYWDRVLALASFAPLGQAITYGLVVVIARMVESTKRARTLETRNERLRASLVESQLNELKSQLQPHFLFNTLNAITSSIHADPDAAETMTVRLSELLRELLDLSREQKRTARSELDFVKKYVEIQMFRFGERLRFSECLPAECEKALIPTLLLQPLVENAIEHNINRCDNQLQVRLEVVKEPSALLIRVIDDGPGIETKSSSGIGLANSRERLQQLYGVQGTLVLKGSAQGGTLAEVSLPFEVTG